MDDIAISVKNVSKSFKLPHERNSSLKSTIIHPFKKKTYEHQEVLKNISFEIKKGEFFGIVGRNGSGKSTLLKILAGIYSPNKGSVEVQGKMTPFIELGVGFNPELTGSENIYLNGALLGFNRKEMSAMYDEIVAFAELEKFMDQKLKNYSSGMQVRLAFSIAIQVQSDVLILDEVLAVGDEAFQKKCIDVFESYKSKKQTIVLVTHDMSTVKRFCTRAILISEGDIITQGNPNKVANDYSELNNEVIDKNITAKSEARATRHKTQTNLIGKNVIKYGEDIHLVVDWSKCDKKVKNLGVALYGNAGEYIFGANTILDEYNLKDATKAEYKISAHMGSGNYHFKIGIFGDTDKEIIEYIDDGPEFTIKRNPDLKWEGLSYIKHEWKKA